MNAENFAEIIKNPSQLYQISYQELKTLVLQYPYCSNLHHLLLIKSHMDQHRDFERVLERTAAGSVDRRHLYHQIRALQPEEFLSENFELGEEFLELRDLSVLDEPPEAVPLPEERPLSKKEAGAPEQGRANFPAPPPLSFGEEDPSSFSEGLEFDLSPEPEEEGRDQPEGLAAPVSPEEPPLFHPDPEIVWGISTWLGIADSLQAPRGASPAALSEAVSADLEAWSAAMETLAAAKPESGPSPQTETPGRPAPRPKHSFSSWTDRRRPTPLRPSLEPLPAPKKKKKKDAIVAFAERSLEENENVISETLAQLLAQQERFDKAIQMYERLILIFPEKSSFFAEKIEQLKKRL